MMIVIVLWQMNANVVGLKFEALTKFQITNQLARLLILGCVRHFLINMNLSDVFIGCTQVTEIPAGFFNNIPTIWMQQELVNKPIETDKAIFNKHRCPNCGATKLIIADCEYCGT